MHEASIARQLPAVARKGPRRLVHPRTERERRACASGFGRAVGQRNVHAARARDLDVAVAHEPFDRRDRRRERQALSRPHVELPAEERDGESLLQQEPVAQIPRLRREVALLRAAQDRERLVPAAVDDLDEDRATRLARIFRPKEQHVGRELDLPVRISRGQIEIGDASVGRKRRIDRKVHTADHALVRPRIVAAAHVDADDFRCR